MTNPERSKVILQSYKTNSAWDLMLAFQNMSELERALLSVQLHLVDSLSAETSDVHTVELEYAWHELDAIMQQLAEERNNGV
jgi:hypothetical protein